MPRGEHSERDPTNSVRPDPVEYDDDWSDRDYREFIDHVIDRDDDFEYFAHVHDDWWLDNKHGTGGFGAVVNVDHGSAYNDDYPSCADDDDSGAG